LCIKTSVSTTWSIHTNKIQMWSLRFAEMVASCLYFITRYRWRCK
jgi:hypothetical protein